MRRRPASPRRPRVAVGLLAFLAAFAANHLRRQDAGKHVYLRLMRLDGSEPRVLACVYGGQGTINVPSWSPDSKRIAFVSNTALPAPH